MEKQSKQINRNDEKKSKQKYGIHVKENQHKKWSSRAEKKSKQINKNRWKSVWKDQENRRTIGDNRPSEVGMFSQKCGRIPNIDEQPERETRKGNDTGGQRTTE